MSEIMYNEELAGDPFMGSPEEEMAIYAVGQPVDLDPEDVGEVLEGAPLGRKLARGIKRVGSNVRNLRNRSVSANARPSTPAQKAAAVAVAAVGDMSKSNLPHIGVQNGIIQTLATRALIPGGAMKSLLERFSQEYPVPASQKTVAGEASGAPKTIEFGSADAAALGFASVAVPVLFLVITSKNDSVRPGASVGISLTGIGHTGGNITVHKDIVERLDGTKALRIDLRPTIKAGETLMPQMGIFGTVDAAEQKLSVTISDLLEGDSAQVITPGYDSVAYANYLKAFNLNLI